MKQVTWIGQLLSSNGITPHPGRVQAIKDMNPPQDVKGVQRFLNMCNYLSRFTPNLAEIVKPLTELTHVNAVWSWSSQHDKAFKRAKSLIANAATLKFFDVNKPCVLQVDASDTGLGGALLQDGQPVAFTSSTLSATEVNYTPTEKECLAIKVACTKFYQYLYGKQDVIVHSDHQPLETIFKKPLSRAPRRLQRMMLQLTSVQVHSSLQERQVHLLGRYTVESRLEPPYTLRLTRRGVPVQLSGCTRDVPGRTRDHGTRLP